MHTDSRIDFGRAQLLGCSCPGACRVDPTYCCTRRLKRDYIEGMADSIDVVPIAAWQGQGRKVCGYQHVEACTCPGELGHSCLHQTDTSNDDCWQASLKARQPGKQV